MKSSTHLLLPALLLALALPGASRAAVETYAIDPAHSSVGFTVRHFFTKVPGLFTKFSGTVVVDRDNLEKSTVSTTIEVASVDTRSEGRDKHLVGPDFFLADKFPSMTFTSKAWKKTGANTYAVTGDLRIRETTKEVVLEVVSLGFGPGMNGAKLSGWEATVKLDRRDFGLTYGQGIVSNDVDVAINVEAVLKP